MDGAEMDAILRQIGWHLQELAVRPSTIYDWLTGRRVIPPNLADWLQLVRDAQSQAPALPDGWRPGE
jgi:hypothetical protein